MSDVLRPAGDGGHGREDETRYVQAGGSGPMPHGHPGLPWSHHGDDHHAYGSHHHTHHAPPRGWFLTRGVRHWLDQPQVRSFLWGAGAAWAAALLWPAIRPMVRPLAIRTAAAVIQFADQTLAAVARAKEDIEDVVAEAREAVRAERGGPAAAGDDLRASVQALQAEMREMRELIRKLAEREAS